MNRAILCTFVALLAACGPSGLENGTKLVYHLDGEATPDEARDVIMLRLEESDADEFEVKARSGGTIEVFLPVMEAEELETVKSLLSRTGRLEFRMVALPPGAFPGAPGVENDERKRRDEMGAEYPGPPDGHRWVRSRSEGGPDRLVEMEGGFTGADLDPAGFSIRKDPTGPGYSVFFTVKEERVEAFTEFTARNVKRMMAIILDDRVHSAPIIQEPLPGRAQISGGAGGFSEAEAEELVSILRSGPLPGELTLLAEIPVRNGEMVLDGE